MVHAAKKAGKWYRGILEAPQQFMMRWHEAEADVSRQLRASGVDGVQGNKVGGLRTIPPNDHQWKNVCARHGRCIPIYSDDLSRDNVTADVSADNNKH